MLDLSSIHFRQKIFSLWLAIVMIIPASLWTRSSHALIGSDPELTSSLVQLARLHPNDAKEMVLSIETLILSFKKTLDQSLPFSEKIKLLQAHLLVAKKGVQQNKDLMPDVLTQFFISKINQMSSDVRLIEFFTRNPSAQNAFLYRKQAAQRLRDRIDWAMFIVSAIKPVVSFL